jgi:cell surface protein SprA
LGFFIGLTFFSTVAKNSGEKGIDYALYNEHKTFPSDTPKLRFPIHDSQDGLVGDNNNFDLDNPSIIKDSVSYDPETNQYVLMQTIGGDYFRQPVYMSFEEYLKYESDKQEKNYFQQKSTSSALLNRKGIVPVVNVNVLDRLFGGTEVDIRPQGNIELTFGGNYTNIQNPSLTQQQRKQGGFAFDMNIQMNVVGKIGQKLKLTTNYNTQAQFDFEKQVKLEYTGFSDEIIKKIEAGNVNLPLNTSLIQGSQSLFGIKTQLQFGRLTVTSVLSEQKSQSENITIQGGSQTQSFSVVANQYDENRNFLLSQYFRNTYNSNMSRIPVITSAININKIEVWVTNRTGATVDTRDVVAFMDMGEVNPYNSTALISNNQALPYANAQTPALNSNNLYSLIGNNQAARTLNTTVNTLNSLGLKQVQDFEKTYARKLSPSEYTLQPQLGYILLNSQLNPDEVLAVAYQYTYNGQVYQVGEFASDVPPDPNSANVLFLKMLKSTSLRPKLPIWDLMMKNVYSIGAYGINPQDFRLDVVYLDPGGGERRFIPSAPVEGIPIIRLLGLDRLNNQNDPQPDGVFDFIPGLTINPQNGKVIFPVLEPFGSDLNTTFQGSPNANRYVFQVLYDSTKTIALQFPEFDRFYMKGIYKSAGGSDISLGAFNIPQGSVSVTAGGRVLTENVDYTVDYNLGRLKVINPSVLNAGTPINVKFENNPAFTFNRKTLFATRLDYFINDKFKLGGTYMRLSERPFTRKLNAGDDPISNQIYGIDASYQEDLPFITQIIDKLPLFSTKDKSSITVTAEGAALKPGHAKAIGKTGTIYIDDFEGTQSFYDLKFPFTAWTLASTPTGQFPEASLIDSLPYGYNRAKFQWYNIDPFFYTNNAPAGIKNNTQEQYGIYTRQIYDTDIFPNRPGLNQNGLPPVLTTFDIKYDPTKRGPYNYRTTDIDPATGKLLNPTKNWGGIMRALDYNDFEAANIEFIQFWVLDPYIDGVPSGAQGSIKVQLGNISEDILKDSRLFFENALPANGSLTGLSESKWSYFPANGQPPINDAFDNDANARVNQDVGYDGASQSREQTKYADYLNLLQATVPAAVYATSFNDPSSDNFRFYRDSYYDGIGASIIARYEDFNNPESNSPITSGTQTQVQSSTNLPESEDLNRDNSLSETEEYFEYEFSLKNIDLAQGVNYITGKVETEAKDDNGNVVGLMRWYQVRIPINEYIKKTGGIQDFKSVRFIRLYASGFEQPITLRFARLELIRNQWRRYNFSLASPGEYLPNENDANASFNVSSVSYEESGSRSPVNYVLPYGIQQEQTVGTVNNFLQNEQALSVQVCDLQDGDARAAFKTINTDLRLYDTLKMFVHAESVIDKIPITNNEMTAFIRLGSDFLSNYYEYEQPLQITPDKNNYDNGSDADKIIVWPQANDFTVLLKDLTTIKQKRNQAGAPVNLPYTITIGNKRITIIGNPDLGLVNVAMLGVRNPKKGNGVDGDDNGQSICGEVWFNELRLSGFAEEGGYAALARIDLKLADIGTVSVSGSMHTIGFGSLEQRLNERFRDNYYAYDASTTIELGKFIPKFIGIKLPMYLGISKSYSNPQYDPYQLDVLFKDRLNLITDKNEKDSLKRIAQNYTSIKSINFTNVRRVNPNKSAKLHFYSIENLNVTYAYSQNFRSTPLLESDLIDKHHADLGYAFPGKSKFIQPFNKLLENNKSKWLKSVKDFNFNFLPTNLSFKTSFDRQFGETKLRPYNEYDIQEPTYNKFFTTDRLYTAKLEVTKGLNIDFNATNNARIDEPFGKIDTQEEKDSIRTNLNKLGRNTHYDQNANISYTLPMSKIPLLDWTTMTAKYNSNYDWLASPQVLDTTFKPDNTIDRIRQVDNPLGNVISNSQSIVVNGDLNMRSLYAKSKWLKRFDTNFTPAKTGAKGDTKDKKDADKPTGGETKEDKLKNNFNSKPKPSLAAFAIRGIISLKKVNLSYTQNRGSVIPGFNYRTNILGRNLDNKAPGYDFIFGMQPDQNWLIDAGSKGWISSDTSLNYQFIQTLSRTITARATFEPAKDFNVDINFSKNYTENTNATFRNTNYTGAGSPEFNFLNPATNGTYSISFIAFKTAFSKSSNGSSDVFNQFLTDREIFSNRLQGENPNSIGTYFNPQDTSGNPSYAAGYGPFSQDVLIPAFISAYSGKDANSYKLQNVFKAFPFPNWKVTYNGISKFKWAKKYFKNFSLSHGYTSTLSIGSFATSLQFVGTNNNGLNIPSLIDQTSGNFIPYFQVPGISITERFSPLIGVDITWLNGLSTKLDWGKGRNLNMSFLNYQLAETRSTDLTFTLGYKWKKFPIPFKIRGKKRKLKNDVNMSMQIGYNQNETNNFLLDSSLPSTPTQGNTTLQFAPTIDYQVNNRLTVRIFYDKRFTIPATSASFPINYTNAGVTIRFTLQ